jgi:pimeloyl-ACP methyl ester carboxylesterase
VPLPGSIAESRYRRLGGLDQWVMFRGENVENPALITLHGGPGFPETFLMRHFNAPLEKRFTVVYWDQRGAGKSYSKKLPKSSMNVEQFISDLDELVDVVRQRLGKDKAVIFGHSWGSLLGAMYAARFPEKVSVYVGGAQIGDALAAETGSYEIAIAEAKRRRNRKALRKLREIGPPPYNGKSVMTERMLLQRMAGELGPRMLWGMARMLVRSKESSLLEFPGMMRAFQFSLDAMWEEASALNLMEEVPELRMPVFFFLGRRDHWVPPETSVTYFEALRAPFKRLVWFEASGHEMLADEPVRFNTVMEEVVRPVALTGDAAGVRPAALTP